MFAWTVYTSFIGAAWLLCLKPGDARAARKVALFTATAGLLAALAGALQFDSTAGLATVTKIPWVPSLHIDYFLAVDGISVTLLLLTGLASVVGVLFSWNIEHRAKEFFAFYLALIGGVYGVFLSFDLFLLFVFYELAIVPKYFLIAIWGSTRREYGAMKLALYSFVGSAMVLVGLLAAYVVSGANTLSIVELAKFPFPPGFQMWAFPLVFTGFAILAGLWPFHTWAPTGHVAAPTAASMLLAGVIMKLGAYGCLRVAMVLFPRGMEEWNVISYSPHFIESFFSHTLIENIQWALHLFGFGSWRDVFGLLALIGIVYGAMVALVQKDFKFVIGYSSVSHMGFVLLGLMTLTTIGLSGAVLQMFSHGVIAGLLFAVVGRMVYDRTHTRVLDELGGMRLSKTMPFAALTFVVAGLASMGMPGFSGFVAEFQVLIGAWKAFPTFAVLAGLGIVIGVAYTLRAVQKAFYPEPAQGVGEAPAASAHNHHEPMLDISTPERIGAALLIGVTLLIGLCPRLLLDLIVPALNSPHMENLFKRGGQ
jgi:NADH-quinone oxidoreductase subunit M